MHRLFCVEKQDDPCYNKEKIKGGEPNAAAGISGQSEDTIE